MLCLLLICVNVRCCIGSCNCNRVNVMWCGALFMSMLAVCTMFGWAVRMSASLWAK